MQTAVNKTLAEIMGLKAGWCSGRGGSMHLYDGKSGNLGSNAIVGGGIPIATGAAWAQRLLNKDSVVVSFFGDGAMNQGVLHEVANMASLWDIPVIYFVENNLYAVGTSVEQSSCIGDLAQRSMSYAIDSLIIDGMDPLAVYLAMRKITEDMRKVPYPFFIEAKTYRHYHHAGRIAGSAFGYRSKEEEAEWFQKDPINAFPQRLIQRGLLTADENDRLEAMSRIQHRPGPGLLHRGEGWQALHPRSKWPAAESVVEHVRGDKDFFPGCRSRSKRISRSSRK